METPIQIRFTDIDIFGHVNNAVYAQWFDTARYAFIKEVLPELDPKGKGMVMVHLETDFRGQIVMDDSVYIETYVRKVGNRSVGIAQQVINRRDGFVHANSYGILSTYDARCKQSFDMPSAWREKLLSELKPAEE